MFFVPTHDRLVQGPMIKGNEKTLYKQGGKFEKNCCQLFHQTFKTWCWGLYFFLCFLNTYRLVLVDIMQ